jgi:hypothetical protein
VNVIFRIDTIEGYRITIAIHLPYNGGDMIDVIKGSNKKQVHFLSSVSKKDLSGPEKRGLTCSTSATQRRPPFSGPMLRYDSAHC